MYDFRRLWRIKEARERSEKYAKNLYARKKKDLRDPLDIGEKALVLAKQLKKKKKKKNAPCKLYKSTTENIPFFNRNFLTGFSR